VFLKELKMGQKNSHSGPQWVVQQEKLLGTLNCEKQLQTRMLMLIDREKDKPDPNQNLQLEEVNTAIKTWFRMYHSVVLLVATQSSTGTHPVNTPEEGFSLCPSTTVGEFCLEKSHVLPAFGLEEDDDLSLSGLRFDKEIKKFNKDYRSNSNDALGRDFINLNLSAQPIFKNCLDKYNSISLARAEVRRECEESISNLASAHAFSDDYVKEALKLIDELWGAQIEDHLAVVDKWKGEARAGSEGWWKAKLGIDDNLASKIGDLFPRGDRNKKKKVWQVAAVARLNSDIYSFVFNRFVYPDDEDISHGLEGVVNKLTALNPQAWSALLSMTYAAVAWQIFNQAKLAVDRVRTLV
jgi:hypothetical protein